MELAKPILKKKSVSTEKEIYFGSVLLKDEALREYVRHLLITMRSSNHICIYWKLIREGWSRDSKMSKLSVTLRLGTITIDHRIITLPNGETTFESEALQNVLKRAHSLFTDMTYGVYGSVEYTLLDDNTMNIRSIKGC
jgi:hypothetical protein